MNDEKKKRLLEKLGPSWNELLYTEFEKPYMQQLATFLKEERSKYSVWPLPADIFRAYALTPYDKVKVVWLGQDPYSGPNQATGLSFDCSKIEPKPRSWDKINEIYDIDYPNSFNTYVMEGDCSFWAKQGVFMLNTALTVRQNTPGSHILKWKEFILATVEALEEKDYVIYVALGKYVQDYLKNLTKHRILTYEHPEYAAQQGRKWDAKGIFHEINNCLIENNVSPINF